MEGAIIAPQGTFIAAQGSVSGASTYDYSLEYANGGVNYVATVKGLDRYDSVNGVPTACHFQAQAVVSQN